MKMLFLLLPVVFSACIFENDNLSKTIVFRANSINSAIVHENIVDFVINCTTPTPCYAVQGKDPVFFEEIVITKILGYSTSDFCVAVEGNIDAAVTIIVDSPGTYTFKFWQSETRTIDTILVIK